MVHLIRTDSADPDFIALVRQLDAYLSEINGAEHDFYAQFNKVDALPYVVVLYQNKVPVSCGAIKAYDADAMEVKRMYTLPASRGRGAASMVLAELEDWAFELGYSRCVLETGKHLPDAVALYERNGYRTIPNYGQYEGVDNSLCFQKTLS